METNKLQIYENGGSMVHQDEPMNPTEVIRQVALIQEVMSACMREGEHYGKIPGCGDKPTLLQPGAQKLILTFRMNPDYEIETIDMPTQHREYRVKCLLTNSAGRFIGAGVGSCSTMEGKYRFRVAPKKLTNREVPKAYWDLKKTNPKGAQEALGGHGFSVRKNDDGQWMIAEGTSEKIEHDNPADYYNTCLKMAKKRALVDATLTRTAASDIFTQDIEDIKANLEIAEEHSTPSMPKGEPKATPAGKPPAGNSPAAPADVLPKVATAETLKWFIGQAETMRQEVTGYLIEKGKILPNETLEDLNLKDVPTSKSAFLELIGKVEAWTSGTAEPANVEDESWREFPAPFGKNAGKKLGDLDKKYLFGLWANFEVETEYNGKPKKPETIAKDQEFRKMLDAAGAHYQFAKE